MKSKLSIFMGFIHKSEFLTHVFSILVAMMLLNTAFGLIVLIINIFIKYGIFWAIMSVFGLGILGFLSLFIIMKAFTDESRKD